MKARLTYMGFAEGGPQQGAPVIKVQEGEVVGDVTVAEGALIIDWNPRTTTPSRGLSTQIVPLGRVLEFRQFDDEA